MKLADPRDCPGCGRLGSPQSDTPSGQTAYRCEYGEGCTYDDLWLVDDRTQDDSTCPSCWKEEVEGGSIDFDDGYMLQKMNCLACDASWMNHYTFSGCSGLVVHTQETP